MVMNCCTSSRLPLPSLYCRLNTHVTNNQHLFSRNSIRFQQFAHRIRPFSSQIKQQKQGSDCRKRRFKPTRKKSKKWGWVEKRYRWGWVEKRYRRNRDGWRRLTILDRVAGRRKRRPAEEGKGGSARRGLGSLACLGSLLFFILAPSLSLPAARSELSHSQGWLSARVACVRKWQAQEEFLFYRRPTPAVPTKAHVCFLRVRALPAPTASETCRKHSTVALVQPPRQRISTFLSLALSYFCTHVLHESTAAVDLRKQLKNKFTQSTAKQLRCKEYPMAMAHPSYTSFWRLTPFCSKIYIYIYIYIYIVKYYTSPKSLIHHPHQLPSRQSHQPIHVHSCAGPRPCARDPCVSAIFHLR
jgi:hypothetical protein